MQYEKIVRHLDHEIANLETAKLLLNGKAAIRQSVRSTVPSKRRRMSVEGRAAIVAAQKKRWAMHKNAA